MILDSHDLQALRECCRDEAAFERVQAILAARLASLRDRLCDRADLLPRRDDRVRPNGH